LPVTHQLRPRAAIGIWATFTLLGARYFSGHGYVGQAFAATLTAFAFFFLLQLLFASRGFKESLDERFGSGSGYAIGFAAFLVYLIYSLGTNTFELGRVSAIAGIIFIPLLLAATAQKNASGAWQDFLIIAAMWVVVKLVPAGGCTTQKWHVVGFLFLLYYSERMYTSRLDAIQKGDPLCLTISLP
jgi:hypothetical protein